MAVKYKSKVADKLVSLKEREPAVEAVEDVGNMDLNDSRGGPARPVKHSPGPWSVDRGQLRDAEGNALASVPYNLGDEQDLANGRLLAAAPAMLAALLDAYVFIPGEERAERIRAVIVQATGVKSLGELYEEVKP
jgi:hypothetical protein